MGRRFCLGRTTQCAENFFCTYAGGALSMVCLLLIDCERKNHYPNPNKGAGKWLFPTDFFSEFVDDAYSKRGAENTRQCR